MSLQENNRVCFAVQAHQPVELSHAVLASHGSWPSSAWWTSCSLHFAFSSATLQPTRRKWSESLRMLLCYVKTLVALQLLLLTEIIVNYELLLRITNLTDWEDQIALCLSKQFTGSIHWIYPLEPLVYPNCLDFRGTVPVQHFFLYINLHTPNNININTHTHTDHLPTFVRSLPDTLTIHIVLFTLHYFLDLYSKLNNWCS